MNPIGYSLIDSNFNEVASTRTLPWSPPPPDKPLGRLATFDKPGQTADSYTVVERWETAPEHPAQVASASSAAYDGTKVIVDRQWSYPALEEAKALQLAELDAKVQQEIVEKVQAQELVLALVKQINALSRLVELSLTLHRRALDAQEAGEVASLSKLFAEIKAIRSAAKVAETELNALTDVREVLAWVKPEGGKV